MQVPPGRKANYTFNEDMADKAVEWINTEKSISPNRPFFVYYAPGGTHTPLQAPKAWIDRFKGKFDMGWDQCREMVYEQQKKLGVIPPDAKLTPRPPEIPAYDGRTPDEKKIADRLMEVYAGYLAQTDSEIGRVVDAIQKTGQLDNTLILYIDGDNGASVEGGLNGTFNDMAERQGASEPPEVLVKHLDAFGGPSSDAHYPVGWAWAGNTPFQWGKQIASHFGGTRNPPGRLLAEAHQGRGRDSHPIPSCHRHRADPPRSRRNPAAGGSQRLGPKANRRREHGLHLRQSKSPQPAHRTILRDDGQPRHVPRRLDRRRPQRAAALDPHGRSDRFRETAVGALPHRLRLFRSR